MPKSTTTANDTLDALLRAVDPAWRSGATRYIALHTANPGEAGYILGNLLSNIPDSVWDELKMTHTTSDSYGKMVQDLEKLAKQIKSLTIAQM